jgi:hypothetical protein
VERRQLVAKDIQKFVTAGKAYFTVVNPDKGSRYTFKVSQPKRENEDGSSVPFFVSVLTGPDNTSHYSYLGAIFGDTYRQTAKSRISSDAPSAKCFDWLWRNLSNETRLDMIEFWHEGRCCMCGRKLTVPESIDAGIGPVCAGRSV